MDLPHGTDVPKVGKLHFGQSNAEENSNSGCRNGCWWVNPSRHPKINRLVREGGIRDLERCFLALGDVAILPLDAWLGNLGAGPAFQNYTEDMLDDVRWRWRWVGNRITDLRCFCPICDSQLVSSRGLLETSFICEHCPADGSLFSAGDRDRIVGTVMGGDRHYAVGATEREIQRRIRTGQR